MKTGEEDEGNSPKRESAEDMNIGSKQPVAKDKNQNRSLEIDCHSAGQYRK